MGYIEQTDVIRYAGEGETDSMSQRISRMLLFPVICLFLLPDIATASPDAIRIGYYDNPPKIYRDDNGDPTGFWPALLREIATREQWNVQWIHCKWADCLPQLRAGNIDIMPDVGLTDKRATRYAFSSEPVLISWSRIYVAAGSPIDSIPDLEGKRIAVLTDSFNYEGEEGIVSFLGSFGITAEFIEQLDYLSVFRAIESGSADAGVTNKDFGNRHDGDFDIRRTSIMFSPASLHFALPATAPRTPSLIATLDRHIADMKADRNSAYYTLLDQHLGISNETDASTIPTWLVPAAAAIAIFISMLIIGNILLNRLVNSRTASLFKEEEQKKEFYRQLEISEGRLLGILRNSPSLIYIKDLEGRFLLVNERYAALSGRAVDEIISRTDADLYSSEDAKLFHKADEEVFAAGKSMTIEEILHLDDRTYHYISTKFPLKDENGTVYGLGGVSTDITELKQHEAEIAFLAHHDALTELPNRRYFESALQACIADSRKSSQNFTLAFFDLDHFKTINDSLGHSTGDAILRHVAMQLRNILRTDDIVARVGGDEFVILLPNTERSTGFETVLGKLQPLLTKPFNIDDQRIFLTASIGVASFPDDGDDSATLMRNADVAMYDAKSAGRNTVRRYHSALSDKVLRRFELESAIRNGLENSEFFLMYQPQFDLQTNQVVGAEALIRWERSGHGLVSPTEFIPAAETSGLIREIDGWVLHEACAQARRWMDADIPFKRISINVSAPELESNDFAERILSALSQQDVPPECFGIELTESMLMENIESTFAQLATLKAAGVFLSIDDFGTGYSSLNYLKLLDVDEIKIDRSFIDPLPWNEHDRVLCETIIRMAKHLGLCVIAEGIETLEQLEFLVREGCDCGQGYFLARPLTTGDFETRFSA
jgi:diguanylate cyclase (GGDEF)-like protein/PAS domain S-box-containing protein